MTPNNYSGQKVIVLGYGRSGKSAVSMMLHFGADVTLTTNEVFADEEARKMLEGRGVEIVDGHHPVSLLNDADLIIKNPGIPYTIDFIKEAQKRGVPIITEVELTGALTKAPIIGITGTNGKTTVTHLIGEMLKNDGKKPILCGNIGYPASEAAYEADSDNILVMELSSFQLMGVDAFKPDIALFTNIYEAHLDYHSDKQEYVAAKLSLMKHLTEEDTVIFNGAQKDMLVQQDVRAELKFFNDSHSEVCIKDGSIYWKDERLIGLDEVLLKGSHNHENILASIMAVDGFGVGKDAVIKTLKSFGGIPHRMEYLGDINGVKYYNDSKATNNLATSFALRSFEMPTVWIAGGLDRGQTFGELAEYTRHVKHLVAYGETKEKFTDWARTLNVEATMAGDPCEAAGIAAGIAAPGDVVLFSPACASWDQYKDYEARGNHFKEGFHKIR
ncbi:UDP-N-acetylmuramoyl-L-alanine--D-glutamate ligase [Lacicoccus alkaliphilus]|uniref:UDP-N-acetylmuramoylalanine--D-glutamate ligase n=1 Tax=Lacicoccus alkaliphilus DSM 16010 TaxID=1123231 RepID=A0A1M7CGV5_9BACL|nr:UDP-N-acetylmuramoyl-L-alanine--D-glutamate ligase [Salinicoccus alkaliphilus]SHL66430.1 UDP-N-acetylmuramoylalanine--D-glutamate ligase [Salinicoccus alkaliphilus DSM 16010]